MSKTVYTSLRELNESQEKIMQFIILWVKTQKTPVPRKEIIIKMKAEGMGLETIKWSLAILLEKGFVRKGYAEKYNTTVYVQLRGL